jgi:hypothetical protein
VSAYNDAITPEPRSVLMESKINHGEESPVKKASHSQAPAIEDLGEVV